MALPHGGFLCLTLGLVGKPPLQRADINPVMCGGANTHWCENVLYKAGLYIFCISDALTSGGPCWSRKEGPSQGEAVFRDSRGLVYEYTFSMQTNQYGGCRCSSHFLETHRGHCPSALITPRPGTRRDTVPMPQSLLRVFQLASPKPSHLTSLVPTYLQKPQQRLVPTFASASHRPQGWILWSFGVACSLLSGTVRNKCLFNCSCLSTCWPHHV